jgi:hypothetical protein
MKKVLLSLGVVAAMAMTSCGGPSVCECVNMDKDSADEAMIEKCEAMEKEWKDKYKEASDEEKEEMMKEIEACEKEGGEEEEGH